MNAPLVDTVSFLTVEIGKDLVLAFAVMDPDDPTEVESLILQRTPVYEAVHYDQSFRLSGV